MAGKRTARKTEEPITPYWGTVASYRQRRRMHGTEDGKRTLCGVVVDKTDKTKLFDEDVANACKKCVVTLRLRVHDGF